MITHLRAFRAAPSAARHGLLALAICALLAAPAAASAANAHTTSTTTSTASSTPTATASASAKTSTSTSTSTKTSTSASAKTSTSTSTKTSTSAKTSTTTSTSTSSTASSTTSTTTSAAPPAARASAAVYLSSVFFLDGDAVTIPGRTVVVSGVVRPYVAGQRVIVKAYLNGRLFSQGPLRLQASAGKSYLGFQWSLRSPGAGDVRIVVQHVASATLSGFSVSRSWSALSTNVGFGSTGRFVELVQQRLSAMHFYIPKTGVYDQGTGLALDAYHRMLGWGASQLLGPATINALLDNVGSFHVRFPNQGRHAEGDLSDQLLALVNGSTVYWILPISSGKPSTPTVLGSWQIYSRVPGYLPDGMYYSDFFVRGYAIHGYDPAPDYPASHGCMRLPIVDAIPVFNWLALGDWVDTYYT